MGIEPPNMEIVRDRLDQAMNEDGYRDDVSTWLAFPPDGQVPREHVAVVAREAGTFAGAVILDALGERLGDAMAVSCHVSDGAGFESGSRVALIEGDLRAILSIERTVLNFLQRLCGVATMTAAYVRAVAGTGAAILDTRKTIPGWRELDKYAVRCGGGHNHRMGLHDAVVLKDNHLADAARGDFAAHVGSILDRLARLPRRPAFVEVEVDTFDQYVAILRVDAVDVILLDNFSLDEVRRAVRLRDEQAPRRSRPVALEVSGGVTLETVGAIARTGVDRISVGAVTHSAAAVDLAFDRLA
jgi:nicotinate-nucleotide pyrophosphorylase (carboxylating)